VPIVYIWAWHADALHPAPWIFFENGRRRRERETRSAIVFRYQDREISCLRQALDEPAGIFPSAVEVAPVLARKAGAQSCHAVPDVLMPLDHLIPAAGG
jgi:hypothetical protein